MQKRGIEMKRMIIGKNRIMLLTALILPAQDVRGDLKMVPHKEAHILACAVPDGLVKPLRHHVPVIGGVFNGTADHRSRPIPRSPTLPLPWMCPSSRSFPMR